MSHVVVDYVNVVKDICEYMCVLGVEFSGSSGNQYGVKCCIKYVLEVGESLCDAKVIGWAIDTRVGCVSNSILIRWNK